MENTRTKFEEQIISKAVSDDNFRNRLLDDPKSVLENTMGIKLPVNINVHVQEETPDDIYIVIPYHARGNKVRSDELSPEELEGISGGWAPPPNKY